jgi:hypothetical protein
VSKLMDQTTEANQQGLVKCLPTKLARERLIVIEAEAPVKVTQ